MEINIFIWANDYNFIVNGDFIEIDQANVNSFIKGLDNQFNDWTNNESSKYGNY